MFPAPADQEIQVPSVVRSEMLSLVGTRAGDGIGSVEADAEALLLGSEGRDELTTVGDGISVGDGFATQPARSSAAAHSAPRLRMLLISYQTTRAVCDVFSCHILRLESEYDPVPPPSPAVESL